MADYSTRMHPAGWIIFALCALSIFWLASYLAMHVAALIFGALIYFVPAIVAFFRSHRQRLAILALNALTGWTFLGWIGSLVWACTSDVEP